MDLQDASDIDEDAVDYWEDNNIDKLAAQNLIEDFNLNQRHKKMTDQEFSNQVLSRFDYYEDRKTKRMVEKKHERYIEENRELTYQPNLNADVNHTILKEQRHENLVNRLDKIIEKKRTNLEKERDLQYTKQQREELKECSFAPKINKSYFFLG